MANPEPGSRAITIPLHSHKTLNHTGRRRRGLRNIKYLDTADTSDTGPSSLSSDQDSSTSFHSRSPAALISVQQQRSIASPSDTDPRLQSTLSTDTNGEHKGKAKEEQRPTSPTTPKSTSSFFPASPLGPDMLSSSSYKSVNLNAHHDDPDEPPRLITYTKHSQGFSWNDEIFLPSYLLGRNRRRRRNRYGYDDDDEADDDEWGDGEGEQCPVTEIFVTDEEVRAMMP